MPITSKMPLAIALFLWAAAAAGQNQVLTPEAPLPNRLGELLDAGAKKLSAKDFRQELLTRTLYSSKGPRNTAILYAENGKVVGTSRSGGFTVENIDGSWAVGANETICSTYRFGNVVFPQRCVFWYKLGEMYFFSDSDSDRSASVERRTLRQ